MKRYNNYHKHTTYSNIHSLDSVTKPIEYIERAIELDGENAIYFSTEHGYQGNIFESYVLCENKGIKLISGAEVYYVENRFEKDKSNYHLILIAKNMEGHRQLNKALSKANIDGFYYKPRIDDEILFNLNPNNFIVTTGCVAGRLRNDTNIDEWICRMKEYFKNNFYLEVQNHNEEIQKCHNKKVLEFSTKYNIQIIHANDSHCIYPEDAKYRDLFLKAKGITYEDESNFILDYPSYDEIVKRYKKQGILSDEEIELALDNTLIFDSFEGVKLNYDLKMPHVSDNPNRELKEIINEEWVEESENIPIEEHGKYLEAIKYEMKIIEDCHMEEYFILDYKIVNRAINVYGGMLTKTGRGSAVSFYINKLLRLTEIDRLKSPVTLYPTRFMSTERILQTKSLPDIDLNSPSRKEFIQATEDLLGKENCGWVVAFKPLQDSSAFRLYCKAIGMKIEEYDEVAKNLDDYREDSKWKDIIEESKHFIGVVESIAPSPCFTKGTLVLTNNGYKEIQDIVMGDYVLTHNNRFKKVIVPMKKKTESILELKVMGSDLIEVTKEHPFYIISRDGRKYTKNKETNKYESIRNFTNPYWKKAEDLTKGDFIGYPVNNNSIIPKFEIERYINKYSKKIVNELDFSNENLWWIIGRYLGDGWTISQKNKNGDVVGYSIIICCNKNNNEKEDIEKHLKGLFSYNIFEEKTVYKIRISNKSLYMYLQKFGKYAHGKLIPNEVIDLPIELLKHFLNGYFSADGYMNEERAVQFCTSVSKKLILGIQQCIHKVYKKPTTLVKGKPSKTIIDGREIIGKHDFYMLSYQLNPKHTEGFYKDGYMWQPFRQYKEKKYDGYVYNMSVEEDESYTVNNIAVHNCSMVLHDKPVDEEIGFIKTKEGFCVNIDGYHLDKFKYLKNDYLQVTVYEIIRDTCRLANIPIPTIEELENLLDDKTFDIYKNKLTCSINQVDSDFATELVSKYIPKSVAEMSGFVAAIRPGFASLLDNFIERKPYTTGVNELDNILEDSYHYLMYQESIMKYLIWLGIEESKTYDIIKKISKKKFKEEELKQLKSELEKGWINQQGNLEGFEETWQVVNDASRYSFNASHSLSYAYDSLYGAYLKAHYPLEYYTVAFRVYDGDIVRTSKLTNELSYFNIKLNPPQFRYSKAEYFMDKETNSIYKGIKSIKYLNKTVGNQLYELRNDEYKTFLDLLIRLEDVSIDSRQLDILIKLDFYKEFGTRKYLLDIVKIYNKWYKKKTFKKSDLPVKEDIFRQFVEKETEKQFSKVNTYALCTFLISILDKEEELSIAEIVNAETEYTGKPSYKDVNADNTLCVVLDVNTKYTPKITVYNIRKGNQVDIKISKRLFKKSSIKKGDLVYLYNMYQKNKMTKDKNGNWIELDSFDIWCDDYKILEKE